MPSSSTRKNVAPLRTCRWSRRSYWFAASLRSTSEALRTGGGGVTDRQTAARDSLRDVFRAIDGLTSRPAARGVSRRFPSGCVEDVPGVAGRVRVPWTARRANASCRARAYAAHAACGDSQAFQQSFRLRCDSIERTLNSLPRAPTRQQFSPTLLKAFSPWDGWLVHRAASAAPTPRPAR